MTSSRERALGAFQNGGDSEQAALAALAEAERLLDDDQALAALEVLVRAESELGCGLSGFRGEADGPITVERSRVHAFLRVREEVERVLPAIRRAIRFPEEARRALELEVERAVALSRAFIELGWYADAARIIDGVELPLGYLGPHPPHRFEWLRKRASWAFLAREIEEARRTVGEYHALFRSAPLPEGELERLLDDLQGWVEVAPVRALVADLGPRVAGDRRLEARLLAWEVASTFAFPWDEAVEADLEARLRSPSVPLLEALVDCIGDALAGRAAAFPERVLGPALLRDSARVLRLLDRLASLAELNGADALALRARAMAHEQMLEVLEVLREEALDEMHGDDAARVRELLELPPWSEQARRERLEALRRAAGDRPDPRTLASIIVNPMLPPGEAAAMARVALAGKLDPSMLVVAAALVDRSLLRAPSARSSEQATIELARSWLKRATRSCDRAFAMRAKELLAVAYELSGDDASALRLNEELAQYFEGRDSERWVRAVERCAMLAKRTGRLSAAGRAARSGFRPGGRVEPPSDDLPNPDDPLEAEEHAERAIAVALRSQDPEVGEAWLRRALALYQKVPGGRRREEEIWKRIGDLWQSKADSLFEEDDPPSEQLDEAHRRAHDALIRAIEVNEQLGDGEGVFTLSGRLLNVLWTWLTRWEDAVDAYLALAQERFRSAISRGDLDHAAAALFDLRLHMCELRTDVSELGPEYDAERSLLVRLEELEEEMAATMRAETARLGEPWWLERIEQRWALVEQHLAALDEDSTRHVDR